jgi:ATP-dependent HslUV protease ATP-binding subunit HslU
MERLLEEVSFHAPQSEGQNIVISATYVFERLSSLVDDPEASKYIL